jgi:excisionase family DNA binding protein
VIPDPSEILTAGDVARLTGTAISKVHQWIDSGDLPGYRVPRSKHRRVHKADLVSFMVRLGMFRTITTITWEDARHGSVTHSTLQDRWGSPTLRCHLDRATPDQGWDVPPGSLVTATIATDHAIHTLKEAGYVVLDHRSELHGATDKPLGSEPGRVGPGLGSEAGLHPDGAVAEPRKG